MLQSRDYICVGIALVLSLILMGLPLPWRQTISQHTTAAFWTSGQWLFSRVIRYATNEHKTRFLLTQNVELSLENMQLREAEEERGDGGGGKDIWRERGYSLCGSPSLESCHCSAF